MTWTLPAGTQEDETVLSASQNTTPFVLYKDPITSKTVFDISDGVWYFNVRARVGTTWGPVSSYQLQIDTSPPTLSASFVYDTKENSIDITGSATDALSGLAGYTLSSDNMALATLAPDALAAGYAVVSVSLAPGTHALILQAQDRAGNTAEVQGTIVVPPSATGWARIRSHLPPLTSSTYLLLLALGVSLASLLMNIILWERLRGYKKEPPHDIAKLQKNTQLKLSQLTKDLGRQVKVLERAKSRKTTTPAQAEYLKKITAHLAEAQEYLDKKTKDITQ